MTRARCTALAAATQAILVALAGCSGGGGTPPRYAVGGVASGLAGQGLVLRLNGDDTLAIAANGPFAFPTRLSAGAAYSVSASAQPDGHLCTVANGSGTVSTADVTNVAVTCIVGQKLVASDGTPSASFGGSVAVSSDGSTVVVGAHLAGSGAAYVYRWNGSRWDELKLTAPDAGDDWFGSSVSTSADGGLVVAGAAGDTVGTNARQGSARVFRWNGSGYVAEATLTAADGAANAQFGSSLALTPDGSTLVVGAWHDDGATTTDQGAAYVFRWNGSTFDEAMKLTVPELGSWDNLGASVAVSEDGNTVVAGAPYHDVGSSAGQGAAYVYAWDGSTWSVTTPLTASNGTAGEYFGKGVALSADGAAVAVGMPFHSTGTKVNHGSVYLYRDAGAGFVESNVTPSDLDAYDLFGSAVSMSASGARVVVGAAQGGSTDRGAVYVYDAAAGGGSSVARLVAVDGVAGDDFGHAVAVSSDGSTVVAGAPLAGVGGNAHQGFVLVFR